MFAAIPPPEEWFKHLWMSSKLMPTLAVVFLIWVALSRRPKALGRLEPVRLGPSQTPRALEALAATYQEGLSALGLRPVGDYQVAHGRCPCFTRFFRHTTGDVLAEVVLYRGLGGWLFRRDVGGLTFFTVLEDGTGIFTGDVALPDGGASAAPGMVLRGVPGRPIAEVLAHHRETVAECVERQQTHVLTYPADQVAEVSRYYAQHQRDHFARAATSAAQACPVAE